MRKISNIDSIILFWTFVNLFSSIGIVYFAAISIFISLLGSSRVITAIVFLIVQLVLWVDYINYCNSAIAEDYEKVLQNGFEKARVDKRKLKAEKLFGLIKWFMLVFYFLAGISLLFVPKF
jgi:hypothetical protein